MIFQFQTGDVTFFEEDQAYFEKKFLPLKKLIQSIAKDNKDSIIIEIHLKKNKHSSGKKFEAKCSMLAPYNGKFFANTNCENIKKCADELQEMLRHQIMVFRGKKIRH